MDGNVRTLVVHPANDAAASELKQHLKDINAQYWRSSYLMEIYISVLEEEARQDKREPDLRAVGERDEDMRREACIVAQQCLAEHQNMSDIRKGLSIDNTQQPLRDNTNSGIGNIQHGPRSYWRPERPLAAASLLN